MINVINALVWFAMSAMFLLSALCAVVLCVWIGCRVLDVLDWWRDKR